MKHHLPRPLVAALLLRACVNAVFAAWLLRRLPDWDGVFRGGAYYAIADGLFGLLTLAMVVKHTPEHAPPVLRSLTFADAMLRLSAGAALLAFPGIPDLPMTIVWFFGAIGVCAAAFGVVAMIGWVVERISDRRAGKPWNAGTHELFDPLAAGGVVVVAAAACVVAFGPPSTTEGLRVFAAAIAAAFAVVFAIASLGAATTKESARRSIRGEKSSPAV